MRVWIWCKSIVKQAQVGQFKEMLKEFDNTSLSEDTQWAEVKQQFKTDPRYKAIGSKTQREKLFLEYLAEVIEKRNEDSMIAGKREAPEDSKVQGARDRKEDERKFKELLSDYIKQPNLTWFDAAKLIEKDKRYGELGSYAASMPDAYKDYMRSYKYSSCYHRQKLFSQYRDLLREHSEITYKSTFEESKKFLESDERYSALSRHAREDLFERYTKELVENVKTQFRQMLRESSYVTRDSQVEGQEFEDLVQVLRMADARCRRMDSWPEERNHILREHIRKLKGHKRK